MRFVFLGSPGVGKGTYAKYITDKYNIPSISTGNILRNAVKEGSEQGIEARNYMEKGELVPDQVVIDIIKDRVMDPDCEDGFILDGFPRTIKQAESLEENGIHIDAVISFTAPKETIVKRLSGRKTCRKCGAIFHEIFIPEKIKDICDHCNDELYQREDDKPEAIRERYEIYLEKTAPLIEYFENKGILRVVDTDKPGEAGKINPEIIRDTEAIVEEIRLNHTS